MVVLPRTRTWGEHGANMFVEIFCSVCYTRNAPCTHPPTARTELCFCAVLLLSLALLAAVQYLDVWCNSRENVYTLLTRRVVHHNTTSNHSAETDSFLDSFVACSLHCIVALILLVCFNLNQQSAGSHNKAKQQWIEVLFHNSYLVFVHTLSYV